ncbi:restriction endonuclease subunit S [Levilactobacillus brevis]|uniref:restriction endonuclease subunit S n=1 Tax=Levilactobacillus brevis TaxID=1580 RepID=UPI001CFABF17|nr:restriction endonuclease subunit S [Levilactobacillus brevis]MCB4356979.1 restriction endonuclease subunit S [Levilactobacillus brevis]
MKDNQAKYPQLRFKGFTDPWEQRKLGEIAIRVRGNDGRMNLPTLTISAGNGWMDQRDRFSQNIAGKEQKNYTLLRQGELSYNHGNSKLAQFGAVFELESYNEALVPRVYHSFSVTAGAQPKFIEQMFATHRPDRELRKLVSSGARMDGLLNINYDDFMGIKVWLPSVAEQQAIAGLLVKLDNTIALHQRKLAKLKELKQGYLQKMFPKNGSKFPQLRFAGFADAWEERKFADFIDVKSGKDYKHLNSGSIPVYGTGGYMLSVDRALSDIDAIGIGRKGTIDKPYLLKAPFWTVDTLFYAVPKQNIDLQFSLSIFKKINWKKFDESTGVPSLSKTVINSVSVAVPSYEEQQKIGSFFKELDDTITLHQRKLEKLQELKKGYLQKMFC